ncbi:PEPxxWA-CTERM sorting domain-containing protein [Sphingomonas sp. BIUV-7]|uniref:PEPxxWA-CTERM sorting domain-containing protein n=1 Tax=Sphingomonas natans TaxID=3063330 RepID=A0ABT8YAP9_9SPHN|nr:PEPxxWA-CTERM sorting domain-containing protein [Sphingomonas sp. BIUV-7]MDO6415406.1 PEPxxWA-CTERM sorting domain-containing protein [Sphingomonas sp. BIUV-7]
MGKTVWGSVAAFLMASASHAVVVAGNTGGTSDGGVAIYGQSFTVSGTGSFNGLAFNFFNETGPAQASGSAFIFQSAYAGTPEGLSSASPGLLAQSASVSGGAYQFDPAFSVNAGQQYFLYTNSQYSTVGSGSDNYQGGNVYVAYDPNATFIPFPGQDANFRLTATSTNAVPEPATWAMFISGFGLIGGAMRRRQRVSVSFA